MLAQIAYSAAFGGSKSEDKVQKLSENQPGGHKVYDGIDNSDLSSPSINVQSLTPDEGINQLEGVERFQDTSAAFQQQFPDGSQINVDSKNIIRMHTVYCSGWSYRGSLMQM